MRGSGRLPRCMIMLLAGCTSTTAPVRPLSILVVNHFSTDGLVALHDPVFHDAPFSSPDSSLALGTVAAFASACWTAVGLKGPSFLVGVSTAAAWSRTSTAFAPAQPGAEWHLSTVDSIVSPAPAPCSP